MDPDDIKLESVSKLFEYEIISRQIDSSNNIDELKNICKSYVKLYFGLEEFIQNCNIFCVE